MVGTITSKGISVRKGDSFNIILQFKHSEIPMDLSGCIIKLGVKNSADKIMFEKIAEIIDATSGKARIVITPDESSIAVGEYKADIQITFKNGEVHTIYPQDINKLAYFRITEQATE